MIYTEYNFTSIAIFVALIFGIFPTPVVMFYDFMLSRIDTLLTHTYASYLLFQFSFPKVYTPFPFSSFRSEDSLLERKKETVIVAIAFNCL